MTLRTRVDHFAARGGLALRRRWWLPERPSRLLAIVHGLAEHSARYDATARWFGERGYAVAAFDQRGHGESEGPRTHAPSFEHLLDDIERFLVEISNAHPALPLIPLGHSMGGLEVALLLARRRPRVPAAVLSGPALALSDSLPRGRLRLARALSAIAPRLPIPQPVDAERISRDPAVVEAYVNDPLIPKRISARLAAELMRAAEGALDEARRVEVPLLIVHGEDDRLCPLEGSRRFCAGVPAAGSELRSYAGLRHEVLNEPEREQVMADIHAWLEKRVPPASAA